MSKYKGFDNYIERVCTDTVRNILPKLRILDRTVCSCKLGGENPKETESLKIKRASVVLKISQGRPLR